MGRLLIVRLLLVGAFFLGQNPLRGEDIKLTDEQLEQLQDASKRYREGVSNYREQKYATAIEDFEACLSIRNELLGKDHQRSGSTLTWLGILYTTVGDYAKAKPAYEQSLEITKKHVGEEHPSTATSLNHLALLYKRMGNYFKAEPLYQQSLRIRRNVLGDAHVATATSLNNLALLYLEMGDFASASPLFEQSLEITTRVQGAEHPNTATCLNNIALLHTEMGNYAEAQTRYQESLAIIRKVYGDEHLSTATSLNNLALLYTTMGDHAAAEPLYLQSLDIIKNLLGESNPSMADSLNNLALLYLTMGDYAKAQPLFETSLGIVRAVHGEEHFSTAMCLANLALAHKGQGQIAKAQQLYEQSLTIAEKVLGEKHPWTATSMSNLASVYEASGEMTKAEPLLRRALAIHQEVLGAKHPWTATSLASLGQLNLLLGRQEKAVSLIGESLAIRRELLDETAAVQTERQQLLMNKNLRSTLDAWLSAARDGAAYSEVLRWKGAVFARQADVRAVRQQPDLKTTVDQLRRVSSRLATFALAVPGAGQQRTRKQQLEQLREERRKLQEQLTQHCLVYRQARDLAVLTPKQLEAALPERTALVDFLEYDRLLPPSDETQQARRQRQIVVFVVRKDQPLRRIELGSAATIDQLIERWHQLARRSATASNAEPAKALRSLVWEPLAKHLDGVETLLMSLDGNLNKLPFQALPGKAPETFLLEDYALALLPVPQTLVGMFEPRPEPVGAVGPDEDEEELSMLVLGGIDYDAESDATTVTEKTHRRRRRAGAGMKFPALDSTRGEALFVQDVFRRSVPDGRVAFLDEHRATEEMVYTLAPKSVYLHFATHGFFAPEDLVSALENRNENNRGLDGLDQNSFMGYHPGLLSGLALPGANKQPKDGNDGVLTALEVAEMDLSNVELAVLSACETGLGRVAGGEGLLGLQRAFQLAGTRTVVASLWKVDDQATRMLMERFYENYWIKEMGMLESLRSAQLWMLKEGRTRGFVSDDEPTESTKQVPPFYWAAFVLSGDWR